MKEYLRIELKRAFIRKWFFVAFVIGCSIAVYDFFGDPFHYLSDMHEWAQHPFPTMYPCTPYIYMLGGHFSSGSYYYFLILPLLAALPYADTLFADLKSGFAYSVCQRTVKRTQYFQVKYLTGFLSGGAAVMIPMLFSFCLVSGFFPMLNPEPTTSTFGITEVSNFPHIFLYAPFVYVLIFLVINFIYGGLYACFAMTATFYVNYRFLVLIAPFLLHLFLMTVLRLLSLDAWVPMNFLQPSYYEYTLHAIIIEGILLFGLTFWRIVIANRKRDIL